MHEKRLEDKKPIVALNRIERYMWLILSACIAIVDVQIKNHMRLWLPQVDYSHKLTPFLNFTEVQNTGIAFGLLSGIANIGHYLLMFNLFFCAAIYLYVLVYKKLTRTGAAISMLLFGGGMGNAYDRMRYGQVYDFIDFHLFGWHWPAFNLADISISLAIILLLWLVFRSEPKP